MHKHLLALILLTLLLVSVGCSGGEKMATTGDEQTNTWITLFDGSGTEGWTMTGPGSFVLQQDGSIVSEGGMGLFYYEELKLKDFVLELEWKTNKESANSGIFVRFPDAPDPWYAVNTGYEIQIDDSQDPTHQTGAVYDFAAPLKTMSKGPGEWNHYSIKVTGQRYQIFLNGEKVNDFYGDRSGEGMIGLQNHDDDSKVAFRNIRVMPLPDSGAPQSLAEHFATPEGQAPLNVLMITKTHGFRHGPAIDKSKEVMTALSATTEFNFDITEDLSVLTDANLANYDLLFFANSTLRLEEEVKTASTGNASMGANLGYWNIGLIVPQGEMPGVLMLSGTPENPSGGIEFEQFPGVAPLNDIVIDGDKLSFSWEGGTFGTITAETMIEENRLTGTVKVQGQDVALRGTRGESPEASTTPVLMAGTWAIAITAPNGEMGATLTITDDEALEGTLEPDDDSGDSWALEEQKREGDTFSFVVNTSRFGAITAKGELENGAMKGTFKLGADEFPFKGTNEAGNAAKEMRVLVSEAQRSAIMNFLKQGKGVVGAHSALDAFYKWDEYREMVGGGLFESHPWTQPVDIVIEEKDNPAVAHFGESFSIRDEIYVLDENPRFNGRVLMSLDMNSVTPQGDSRGMYRNDYPISWIREHNGGRVFMTKLGHFPEVWANPDFLQHLLQGMRMAAGRIESDFSGQLVKETIADNVWPDDIAVDDMGNVWIAELRGKVHRYDAASGETKLIGQVPTTNPEKIEHGLYGIEVDPDFYNGSPYVYLFYAERETIINTLSRFEYRDGAIDFSSEEVLLRVPTEPQCCHQAGDIEWGPDGTLYLSTGDTGMSETRPDWELTEEELDAFKEKYNLDEIQWSRLVDSERSAQNLQDLRGKILRINRDGSIPKDNPFYGEPGVRWEVYAYGLRNPYRFKIDPQTGYLYIGVVGPDAQFDYDEYNISTKGGENFGWPREIGRLIYNEWSPDQIPNYTPPFWEYTYETGGRSASGGPVYRHEGEGAFPPIFQNRVFVYDWARSWIKYGKVVEEKVTLQKANGDTYEMTIPRLVDVKTLDVLRGTRPISMELGPDGALYVAEFTGFWDAAPGSKVTRYRWVSRKSE